MTLQIKLVPVDEVFINLCVIHWPDYEEEDYEEGEGEEEEPEGAAEKVTEDPRKEENSVDPEPTIKENDVEDDHRPEEEHPEPTSTTSAAPVADLCALNNGGCDHNCRFHEEEGQVECSCFAGFTLNAADGRTCQGESHSYLETDSGE